MNGFDDHEFIDGSALGPYFVGKEKIMNVREAAFLSLMKCSAGGKYSNLEVNSAIKKYGFAGNDRALFTALVYGTIEKRITIDYIIGKFSDKPINRIEPKLLEILRLGVYQILFLDRIPDSAACNESVEIAKFHTHKGTAGFVNGVLRHIAREKNNIEYPPKGCLEYYSVKYACPKWLCEMWLAMYGNEKSEKILEGINRNPHITLRVNTLKTNRVELAEILHKSGISCCDTVLSPFGLTLDAFTPISEVTPVAEGLCFVQDEASQLCAMAMGAVRGDFVIDTCSCPGGKSFGMAMDMENDGGILSFDLHESKLSLVKSGAERLGIDMISTGVQNGAKRKEELIGKADKVLCDVPCSGLGVIAKKPDLRHKAPDDIERLPDIQYSILENASHYVKQGGYLLYSTCTLNKKENEDNRRKFLDNHTEFEATAENMPFGKSEVTFFPDEYGTDGFYMAKFKKK